MTFKKSEDLRAIARDVPLDRIWSRPTRPILRRRLIADAATSRPSSSPPRAWSPRRAGLRPRRWPRYARQHARDLSQASAGTWIDALTLRLTILGCGSSGGVPRLGEGWGACDPSNPKNRRRRCSVLVERLGAAGATTILVDTSPDLREQLLDAGVERLDSVLLSHPHADHTHGIDDLRSLCLAMRRRMDSI